MRIIDKESVLIMYQMLIEETGGGFGIRDENILESSISAPFQTFDGSDLYQTINEKAARLCYNLIKNHPFIDGNKRIGVFVMLVFLEMNGIVIKASSKELVDIAVKCASSEMDYEDILTWLQQQGE